MNTNEKPSAETLENWHKDPNNWKWGLFYYNKEDKRTFVPKKIEWMGITINFANKYGVLFFILLMIFIVGLFYYLPGQKN